MLLKRIFTPYSWTLTREARLVAAVQAVILIGLWFTAPNSYIPSPLGIARAWDDLAANQGLLPELLNSATTVWQALFLSTIISLSLAFIGTAPVFNQLIRWATALRFLGFAGITFMFTLIFGGGATLKLWLLTFGMTVFFLTSTKASLDAIGGADVDYVRTLKLSGWGISWELGVRGRLAEILDIARQNAAIGWTLLSMVEGLVRSEGGVGAMIMNQNKHFHLEAVFAIQLTILIYGISQDWVLGWLRNMICPYTKLVQA